MAVDADISGSPSFLKIILAPRLDLQKLEIPPEFMKRYGGNFLNVVHLSIPSGAVWEVKLVRKKGRGWLQNGWPEFVNFYSILHTHVLKFTLEGNSRLHVIIMSNNASEIEYPVDIRTSSPTQKRKKMTINTISPNCSKRAKVAATVMETNRKRVVGSRCSLGPDELKKVDEYPCKQPSFMVKITPCQLEPKFNGLNIPREFVRSYLQHETRMFILQSASQETWSVRCMIEDTHMKLAKGWRNFARDNKLQVGDICVFELMKVTKTKFKVGILPAAPETPRSKVMKSLCLKGKI